MNQREAGIAAAIPPRARSATACCLLLLLAYIFNFIDRQIIGILAVPIKAELGLSDRQLGLMGGLAFALFYSTLALPIAWFADRKSRIAIISASVAVWSLFTALCGLAQNFWQLFLARMGVGIGEAGGVAPSYSLIADYFPSSSRARALAFFSLGIPTRLGARHLLRRLDRQQRRLARGVHHRRAGRPADRIAAQAVRAGAVARRDAIPAPTRRARRPSWRSWRRSPATRVSGCCRSAPRRARSSAMA